MRGKLLSVDSSNSCVPTFAAIANSKDSTPTVPKGALRLALLIGIGIVLTIAMTMSGCASAPVPTEQLAVSKAAVDSATTAGGTEFAPLELKAARDKLDAAKQAVTDKDYEKAAALASEAQVDAKLAETKALSAKALKSVAETQDNLRSMLQEINRSNTQQQEQQQQLQRR